MINPLSTILQEIHEAQAENLLLKEDLTKAIEEFNVLTIQPWELPEE